MNTLIQYHSYTLRCLTIIVFLWSVSINSTQAMSTTPPDTNAPAVNPLQVMGDAILGFIAPHRVYFTTLYFPRTVSTSFNYISDFSHAPTWDTQALSAAKLTSGEIGVGSKFNIVTGIAGFFEYNLPYEVIQFSKDNSIVFKGETDLIKYQDTLRFKKYGLGTRLEYTAEISFTGLLAIFNPLLGLIWNSIGANAVAGMPSAILNNTQDDLISSTAAIAEINRLFSQQNTSISTHERAFLDQLYILAEDLNFYFQGVSTQAAGSNAAYTLIKSNLRARLKIVEDMARTHYTNSNSILPINVEDRVLLARNAFLLMSYYTFTTAMPNFLWTKLGDFAANEVRRGLVMALSMERILSLVSIIIPDELSNINFVALTREAASQLIEGQLDVFVDVGGLALMNQRFGSELMSSQSWLTPEASRGYVLQAQAEKADSIGNIKEYMALRAAAAIEFGAHEQLYTLQPLWDLPLMSLFAAFNNILLKASDNQLALVQPHIYLGENDYSEQSFGPLIIAPKQATDLTVGEYRVDIARNGFNTLTALLQNPLHAFWINNAQASLGHANNLYQPLGLNWLPEAP